jgi:uncharacterized protein (DUF1330 family)
LSAYLINHLRIPSGVPNEEDLSNLEQVESTVKAYGGRWLAQGEVQVVEGAWPGSVVLMEFPSMTDARNWYNSSDYQKILHRRVNNAISDLILVDGVRPDFTVAGFAQQIRVAARLAARSVDRASASVPPTTPAPRQTDTKV